MALEVEMTAFFLPLDFLRAILQRTKLVDPVALLVQPCRLLQLRHSRSRNGFVMYASMRQRNHYGPSVCAS